MQEIVSIIDYNPAVFFQELESNVKRGFYANDTVHGHPQFGVLNTIVLQEAEQPTQIQDLSGTDEVVLQEYDNTTLVLKVQDAILQGFTVDLDNVRVNEYLAPHSIRLTRAVAPTFALGPVKAEPVPSPSPVAENASQSTTEAPKPVNKGGRPAKQKSKEL